MVAYDAENEEYLVDYDKFDITEEVLFIIAYYWLIKMIKNKEFMDFQVDTPLCSAQRFDEISKKVKSHFSKDENDEQK